MTWLTVYHQFGSRQGLLRAVFEHLAEVGGIARLADAAAHPDPLSALDDVVEVFCRFWDSDRAVSRIYDAIPTDPEIAEALRIRMARGHALIADLVKRAVPKARDAERQDAADLIATLTNLPSVTHLSVTRDAAQVAAPLQKTCRRILADIA